MLALTALTAGTLASPAASPIEEGPVRKPGASDDFFRSGHIPHLRITIAGSELAALRKDHRRYIPATVREGDTVYAEVGIHLKGAAGSFRGLDDRPALTLNFDKFIARQRYRGLDKLHLNNSVQDPSYLTEILCGDLFRAAGVPTPRGTHARVELNGRDLGLYVLKEGFDREFLKQHFENTRGNLYDGGFLREITQPLDRTSGDGPDDHADLKALAAAAQEPDPGRRIERLHRVLDLDRFLSFIALEVMTWHWDGYAMKRNNYRVYHDPGSSRIVFFPHGMDQMFWAADGPIFPNFEGLVARAVVSTPEGRRRYRDRMAGLLEEVFVAEVLTNRIQELQARLRPVLESIHPRAARQHEEAVRNLRRMILDRIAGLERLLNQPEPKPLAFDRTGRAAVTDWQAQDDGSGAVLEKTSKDGPALLYIRARPGGRCTASWRARVLLEGGGYRFEGRVRTAGVAAIRDEKGEGAGLRLSGSQQPRANQATGDSAWQQLTYDLTVPPGQEEVVLVCELRATQGEVWFEVDSFRLVRK